MGWIPGPSNAGRIACDVARSFCGSYVSGLSLKAGGHSESGEEEKTVWGAWLRGILVGGVVGAATPPPLALSGLGLELRAVARVVLVFTLQKGGWVGRGKGTENSARR